MTVPDLLGAGTRCKVEPVFIALSFHIKIALLYFLSSLNVEFLHKQVQTIQLLQMQICMLVPEWNLHSVLSTVQQGVEEGTSAQRWKKASDEDSLIFLGLF